MRSLPIGLTRFLARLTRSDWRPERGDVVSLATGDRHAIHYEHQFVDGELEHEARAAGLTVVFHERRELGIGVLWSRDAPETAVVLSSTMGEA